jgi:N-acetylmuramoyl-L-alanine amidase
VIERPSPNHDARPESRAIDMLVLHYTGMTTAEAALERLCDPAAKVSAHYCVDEDGTVIRLVGEGRRAWHAGTAYWRGERDINGCSLGIELVNPGHEFGYRPFSETQIAALTALCRDIVASHPIPPERVLGHSDVAPQRKQDPGELFDWAALAEARIGLWPTADFAPSENAETLAPGASGTAVIDLQLALDGFGYDVQGTGLYDPATKVAITAFQRHWRQSHVDGIADAETQSLLHHLLENTGLGSRT